MTTLARYLVTRPWAVFLYVLVYWGRALWMILLAANVASWLSGGPRAVTVLLGLLAFGALMFNVGFDLRDAMPTSPPGRRR